ncbi:hypothetical protein K466DRAFT_512800 [Polyporus arcularius HHB13444]|uniref:Tethering factor for nuclear proteasome STS1 n=1 Tax=Polyporus arcularius HHB13444 TaxID=1314778 RepID=A0A5C3Q2W5_9APHY|nr:hypothetical protein K466DRAFT_512800 [Polyporus arcularius HHB13444]
MANVVTHPHLQVGFGPSPVGHSPSPLGFGFGLQPSMIPGWPTAPHPHVQPPAWGHPPQTTQAPVRTAKRRHEPEEEDRDERMDRSPTPERVRRAVPKRARTTPAAVVAAGKDQRTAKENKPPTSGEENDVDVGFLLASLPPQSLLPLVTSLLSAHPALKPTILSLIPRPTLDAALQSLATSAQKLKDAYPYSNSLFSQPSSWNNAGGFGSNRSPSSFSTGFGFGARSSGGSTFGSASPGGGMRDEYIVTRLKPHIEEFVAACTSYLPYFSYTNTSESEPAMSVKGQTTQTHAAALRQQHKDKLHPHETYLFLAALTSHILSQPPLTQASIVEHLAKRLQAEWEAWVDRVDEVVNRQGGMFGIESVSTWARGLDEFAQAKEQWQFMEGVRDRWVLKVGWLVGRRPMETL